MVLDGGPLFCLFCRRPRPARRPQRFPELRVMHPAPNRPPVCLRTARLSSDLLAYLQTALPARRPEDLRVFGFERQGAPCSSAPQHVCYEGHFHVMAPPGPVTSLHPRGGVDVRKPAAPLQVALSPPPPPGRSAGTPLQSSVQAVLMGV